MFVKEISSNRAGTISISLYLGQSEKKEKKKLLCFIERPSLMHCMLSTQIQVNKSCAKLTQIRGLLNAGFDIPKLFSSSVLFLKLVQTQPRDQSLSKFSRCSRILSKLK